jgi:hypothetical protein
LTPSIRVNPAPGLTVPIPDTIIHAHRPSGPHIPERPLRGGNLDKQNNGASKLAGQVAQDPALAANVLGIVHSAYYGLTHQKSPSG